MTKVNLHGNNIGPQGAKVFAAELKDTAVTQVDLSDNNIGPQGAKDFAAGLKFTKVTKVNLSRNKIGMQGAKDVIAALAGSHVTHLDLNANDILANLAALIENTNLLDLTLEITHPAMRRNQFTHPAIKTNQDRNFMTPYEAARLYFLPQDTKEMIMLENPFLLSKNSSNQEQIKYAGSILAHPAMPPEIVQHIVSFLPTLNATKAKHIFNAARNKPPTLIENNLEEPKIDSRVFVRAPSLGSSKP